jgi:hypothetical protein
MYFPKSQIIENLYTNGGELKPFNEESTYIGHYYKTSTGEFFSGKNPSSNENIPLEPLFPLGNDITNPNFNVNNQEKSKVRFTSLESEPLGSDYYVIDNSYYKAKSLPQDRGKAPRPPIQSIPKPTQENYKEKKFNRYFVKKVTQVQFIEVNKEEYKLFENQDLTVQFNLYTPINIEWNLIGDRKEVYQSNKTIVSLTEQRQNIYGFTLFFKEQFDKYYQSPIQENLQTDGTEYKNKRTGQPYKGPYHIHPEKGPMVGEMHVDSPHDYLIPITSSNSTVTYTTPIVEPTTNSGGSLGGGGGGY